MTLNAHEAGSKLAEYLKRIKMQQKELALFLDIEPSYISRMVKGHINWTTGQYFGKIASYLRLNENEIRALNPAAVVELISDSLNQEDRISIKKESEIIPQSLLEAAEIYQKIDHLIADKDVQSILAMAKNFKNPPKTSQDWIRYFNDVRHWIE